MNQNVKARWIEALRSGRYTQGRHLLRSPGDKYCCLGVLCDLAVEDEVGAWVDLAPGAPDGQHWNLGDSADGFSSTALTRKVMDWSGVSPLSQDALIQMNDQQGASFEEIAQYIEEEV